MGRDTVVALGLIVLAGLYWLGADQIRVSRLEGIVGAQAVPKGLAATLLILSVLLIVQDLWRARHRRQPGVPGVGADAPGDPGAPARALGMLLIGVAYLCVVGLIGYLPAIALLMLTVALYAGRPWSLPLVLIALGGAALYYLMFVRLLGIPLPAGIWPDLWRELGG
jgi:putative tricarboxylic transport membrane protein